MMNDLAQASNTRARVRVWDLPVRLFHWLLVGVILIAFLSAEEESALSAWHIPAGWCAAVLIAFRIVWGFVGGEHSRFASFLRPSQIAHHLGGLLTAAPARSIGHNPLGGVAVIALLGTIGGIVYTGVTMLGEGEGGLHETLSNALLGLIALHVVAVIAMSLLTRDNLIRAFITGTKRSDLHPGFSDAQPPSFVSVPVAAIALAGAAYAATSIDPQAFTPGAHGEAGEGTEGMEGDDD